MCDYVGSSLGLLWSHMRKHSGEKPNKCDQCPFETSYPESLRRHIKIHSGEKPNKCTICKYASLSRADLMKHLKTHTLEKPFKCSQCDFASKQKGNLRAHELNTVEKSRMNAISVNLILRVGVLCVIIKRHIKQKS